jgi:hypothetical protein
MHPTPDCRRRTKHTMSVPVPRHHGFRGVDLIAAKRGSRARVSGICARRNWGSFAGLMSQSLLQMTTANGGAPIFPLHNVNCPEHMRWHHPDRRGFVATGLGVTF